MKMLSLVGSIVKFRFFKSDIDRLLGYSILFSISLVLCRIWYTHDLTFMYMPWNLLLAYIPYIILHMLQPTIERTRNKILFSAVFFVWLLFIPNAFYMVTDLFHLYHREGIPLWFDLVLLMSYAWNGMVLGTMSIRQMEKTLAIMVPRLKEEWFVGAIMFLNAFGIYLGRYLRFNSWDIVSNPISLAVEMFNLVAQPVQYKAAWAMILSFTIMMIIMYQMLKKLSRQLR